MKAKKKHIASDPVNQSSKRRTYHHGDLRGDLLRIARDDVARGGASELSLSSLARLAGVTQPAPYRHFSDRHALLECVAVEAFEEFDVVLTEATTRGTPQQKLHKMAKAYLKYGEANTEIYRLMFASRLVPEARPGSSLAMAADKTFNRLQHTMAEISLPETFDARDAMLVWAQLHGLVMLRVDGFVNYSLSQFLTSPRFLTNTYPLKHAD